MPRSVILRVWVEAGGNGQDPSLSSYTSEAGIVEEDKSAPPRRRLSRFNPPASLATATACFGSRARHPLHQHKIFSPSRY